MLFFSYLEFTSQIWAFTQPNISQYRFLFLSLFYFIVLNFLLLFFLGGGLVGFLCLLLCIPDKYHFCKCHEGKHAFKNEYKNNTRYSHRQSKKQKKEQTQTHETKTKHQKLKPKSNRLFTIAFKFPTPIYPRFRGSWNLVCPSSKEIPLISWEEILARDTVRFSLATTIFSDGTSRAKRPSTIAFKFSEALSTYSCNTKMK